MPLSDNTINQLQSMADSELGGPLVLIRKDDLKQLLIDHAKLQVVMQKLEVPPGISELAKPAGFMTFRQRMQVVAEERIANDECPNYVSFGPGHQSHGWCQLTPPHAGDPHALDVGGGDVIEWETPPEGKEAFHDHGWADH